MGTEAITASSCGNGVVCPECGMTMYEMWRPPLIRRVVRCLNRHCVICGQDFVVKEPEVTLTPLVPVSSSEAT